MLEPPDSRDLAVMELSGSGKGWVLITLLGPSGRIGHHWSSVSLLAAALLLAVQSPDQCLSLHLAQLLGQAGTFCPAVCSWGPGHLPLSLNTCSGVRTDAELQSLWEMQCGTMKELV